jgi:hypothetical protein
VAASSCARVVSIVVALGLCTFDVSGSLAAEVVCIDAGLSDGDLDDLIIGALDVLRQSGHDPEGYRLELEMARPAEPGFAEHRVNAYPSVVFFPEDGDDRYALRVDRSEPCGVSWVWWPDRFTPWQRRVVVRAREVLRDTWPGRGGERLSGVTVVETAQAVIVSVSLGEVDDSGLAPSRAEITLRRSDLSAVEPVD